MKLTFDAPGEPIPKGRPRTVLHNGRIMTYTPKTTVRCEGIIRTCCGIAMKKAGILQPVPDRLIVSMGFYRSTAHRLDLDNLIKTCLDALNGVAFKDDSQVVGLVARKYIDRGNPRTEVEIETDV